MHPPIVPHKRAGQWNGQAAAVQTRSRSHTGARADLFLRRPRPPHACRSPSGIRAGRSESASTCRTAGGGAFVAAARLSAPIDYH